MSTLLSAASCRNPRSVQCWPEGKLREVRGDSNSPDGLEILDNCQWRETTADECRAVRIEELAEAYADRDVLCCDSSLVSALIDACFDGFGVDDWENLYPDPSNWPADECRDWLRDHGVDLPGVWLFGLEGVARRTAADQHGNQWTEFEVDHLAEQEPGECRECGDETESGWTCLDGGDECCEDCAHIASDDVDELRQLVNDHAEASEVFEWWRVTDWLCEQLRQIGEVVIDNDYGYWWGRCCTGQGLIMDGVLQRIAAQFEEGGAR